jgi:hypothetical protein
LHWIGLGFCCLCYFIGYSGISALTRCTYDEKGELIDGGADLSIGGLSEYYFDIIYISWFVQLATAFVSDWGWAVYLVVCHYKTACFSCVNLFSTQIPLFAFYKLWGAIIKPWLTRPDAQVCTYSLQIVLNGFYFCGQIGSNLKMHAVVRRERNRKEKRLKQSL